MAVDSFNQLLLKLEAALPQERRLVEEELNTYDIDELIPDLIENVLNSENDSQRINSVKSLTWIGKNEVIGDLKHILLHDHCDELRIAIINMIGTFRESSMLDTLLKIVDRDDNVEVIQASSIAIQVIQGITDASSMDIEY